MRAHKEYSVTRYGWMMPLDKILPGLRYSEVWKCSGSFLVLLAKLSLQLGHDFILWNIFIIWKKKIVFTISVFWNSEILRSESQKTLCVFSTFYSDCAASRQKYHVKRSLVHLLQELPQGSDLCLCYRRWQNYEPLCIWPTVQCSSTRGNSFLTPAVEQLCPAAQDGHAL